MLSQITKGNEKTVAPQADILKYTAEGCEISAFHGFDGKEMEMAARSLREQEFLLAGLRLRLFRPSRKIP
jgi:hypothetical protein